MIDFSCKHDIYIKNPDGTYTPMDEPWYQSEKAAEGVWLVKSEGDYSWLVEGDDEALAIDSGYGAGNIRTYMQALTDRPVKNIANTHYHFDHTANNSYFDCAYMSEKTRPLATIPYPSFEGITFPRDYPVKIVSEGDVIDLGGRKLEVFSIPDHTPDGTAYLDRKNGILFSGDEIGDVQRINGTVEQFYQNMAKLEENIEDIRMICTGFGIFEGRLITEYAQATKAILNGCEGTPMPMPPFPAFSETYMGKKAYIRFMPHAEDMPHMDPAENKDLRLLEVNGSRIVYHADKIFGLQNA